MNATYSIALKKKLCEDICLHGKSTIALAKEFNVPLKTLEKWITAFNKDNHCFDVIPVNDFHLFDNSFIHSNYDDLSIDELKKVIMKKDIELARLKKGYAMKEGGSGEKVFVTFSKKNTK